LQKKEGQAKEENVEMMAQKTVKEKESF